jgi:hypothetical protein
MLEAVGQHETDDLADEAGPIGGDHAAQRLVHLVAGAILELGVAVQPAEPVLLEIGAGEHADHAGCRLGGTGLDAADRRMGMRRA